MLTAAFLQEASDSTGIPIDEYYPELTDDEVNQAVPEFTELLKQAVASHIISNCLNSALQQEARDLAQAIIKRMDDNQVEALLERAKAKVKDECDDPEEEDTC